MLKHQAFYRMFQDWISGEGVTPTDIVEGQRRLELKRYKPITKDNIQDWKRNVGKPPAGNSRLVLQLIMRAHPNPVEACIALPDDDLNSISSSSKSISSEDKNDIARSWASRYAPIDDHVRKWAEVFPSDVGMSVFTNQQKNDLIAALLDDGLHFSDFDDSTAHSDIKLAGLIDTLSRLEAALAFSSFGNVSLAQILVSQARKSGYFDETISTFIDEAIREDRHDGYAYRFCHLAIQLMPHAERLTPKESSAISYAILNTGEKHVSVRAMLESTCYSRALGDERSQILAANIVGGLIEVCHGGGRLAAIASFSLSRWLVGFDLESFSYTLSRDQEDSLLNIMQNVDSIAVRENILIVLTKAWSKRQNRHPILTLYSEVDDLIVGRKPRWMFSSQKDVFPIKPDALYEAERLLKAITALDWSSGGLATLISQARLGIWSAENTVLAKGLLGGQVLFGSGARELIAAMTHFDFENCKDWLADQVRTNSIQYFRYSVYALTSQLAVDELGELAADLEQRGARAFGIVLSGLYTTAIFGGPWRFLKYSFKYDAPKRSARLSVMLDIAKKNFGSE